MDKKTFAGATRAEAVEMAIKWWAAQEGVQQAGNWGISAGTGHCPNTASNGQ